MENRRNFLGKIGVVIGGSLLLSKVDWKALFSKEDNAENQEENKTGSIVEYQSYGHYLSKVLESHRLSKNTKQIDKLNKKFTAITEALQGHYRGNIYAPYKTGSIAKGTGINTYYDLDMLVPFKYDTFSGDYKKMFEDLFKTLENNGFKPKRQSVSIGVPINLNGKEPSYIDVVPGHEINRNNYESSNGDLILHVDRDSGFMGKTIKTNIKRQFDYIKSAHPSAINVIRLLKIWRITNNVCFKSFVIELITIQALKAPPKEKDLFSTLSHVMNFMAENMATIKLKDPGNSKNDVMKALPLARRKELAGIIGDMLKELEQEEKEGKMKALKKYFPMK